MYSSWLFLESRNTVYFCYLIRYPLTSLSLLVIVITCWVYWFFLKNDHIICKHWSYIKVIHVSDSLEKTEYMLDLFFITMAPSKVRKCSINIYRILKWMMSHQKNVVSILRLFRSEKFSQIGLMSGWLSWVSDWI